MLFGIFTVHLEFWEDPTNSDPRKEKNYSVDLVRYFKSWICWHWSCTSFWLFWDLASVYS